MKYIRQDSERVFSGEDAAATSPSRNFARSLCCGLLAWIAITARGQLISATALLAIVVTAMLLVARPAAAAKKGAAQAPATQPAGGQEAATFITSITTRQVPTTPDPEWKGGGKSSDLYWLCDLRICGPYIVTIGRNDMFCVLQRDVEKGTLTYKSSVSGPIHNWGWFNLASKELPDHNWIIYVATTHMTFWAKLDVAAGKLEMLGQSPAGGANPYIPGDGSRLFVAGAEKMHCFNLDPATGVPTLLSNSNCKGDFGCMSPDGRNYYAQDRDDLESFSVDPRSGELHELPATPLQDAAANHFALVACSPDGKFVYRPLNSQVAVLARNPDTGALTFKENEKLGDMGCAFAMIFTPDGKYGFFNGMSRDPATIHSKERPSDCVGAFCRDPATGALTYIGKSSKRGGYTMSQFDAEHNLLYVLIKMGPSSVCVFKMPRGK